MKVTEYSVIPIELSEKTVIYRSGRSIYVDDGIFRHPCICCKNVVKNISNSSCLNIVNIYCPTKKNPNPTRENILQHWG
jgi:hypothetical protein